MKVIKDINTLVSAALEVVPECGKLGQAMLYINYFCCCCFSMLKGSLNIHRTITCVYLRIPVFIDIAFYKRQVY